MASSLIASNSYGYIPVTLTMTQRLNCMFLGWQHQILITMKVKLIVSSFACFDWQYNFFTTKKDSTDCYLCCYTNSLRTEKLWLTRWLFKLWYRLSTHTCPITVYMNGISNCPAVALSRSVNWLSTRNWRQDVSMNGLAVPHLRVDHYTKQERPLMLVVWKSEVTERIWCVLW